VVSLVNSAGARVAAVDDALLRAREATTSISLGFLLEDGRTVALWMPRNEAEFDALNAAPPPMLSMDSMAGSRNKMLVGAESVESEPLPSGLDTDLWAVGEGGKRWPASFLALDGGTGVTLISVAGAPSVSPKAIAEPRIEVGDSLMVVAPEPLPEPNQARTGALRVGFGETEARIVNILRGSTGKVSRIVIDVAEPTENLVGGVAVNGEGFPIGIVQDFEGGQAELVPAGVIRRAAARAAVSASIKPRVWLGVRGEDLLSANSTSLESFGWTRESASALVNRRKGLLLTSVAPGTPAHLAALRAGDVVVKVNGTDVVSKDDFSSLISVATSESALSFTLLRPKVQAPVAVTVKPGRVVDPVVATMLAERRAFKVRVGGPLSALGIDVLKVPRVQASPGFVSPGLLVLNVAPQSEAYKAGLRAGDQIQQINGNPAVEYKEVPDSNEAIKLSILRAGQAMELKIAPGAELVP
jgi:S1-C subfamily serine protease